MYEIITPEGHRLSHTDKGGSTTLFKTKELAIKFIASGNLGPAYKVQPALGSRATGLGL